MPRRRTSNADKKAAGTMRSNRRHYEVEYEDMNEVPKPPSWLTGPLAVKEFKARAADMVQAGVLQEAQVVPLAHYCAVHQMLVNKWRSGEIPSASDLNQLRQLACEFGFTPASRSKAGDAIKPKKKANPFNEMKVS